MMLSVAWDPQNLISALETIRSRAMLINIVLP